jgi:hypothetical protein
MPREEYKALNIYSEDYDKLISIKKSRKGITLAGLFREMVDKYITDHTLPAKEK